MTFREVSRSAFFAAMNPRDVTPRPERDVTLWKMPSGTVVGRSTPGYLATGPVAWFLAEGVR